MDIKAWAVGVLYLVLLMGLAATEKEPQAKLEGMSNDIQEETVDEFSTKNITDGLEELKDNADGVDIFLSVVEKVVVDGGETVTIPADIDPEQHNISLNDALDRTQGFLLEQNNDAKDLLSKVYGLLKHRNRVNYSLLEKIRDEIVEIMKNFADAEQDIADYRKLVSDDQMYDYYYDDNDTREYGDEEDDAELEDESGFEDYVEDMREVDDNVDFNDSEDDSGNENEKNLVLNLEGDSDDDEEMEVVVSQDDAENAIENNQYGVITPDSTTKEETKTTTPQEGNEQETEGNTAATDGVISRKTSFPNPTENSVDEVATDEFISRKTSFPNPTEDSVNEAATDGVISRKTSFPIPTEDSVHEEQQFNAILVEKDGVIEGKEEESLLVREDDVEVEETDVILEEHKETDESNSNNSTDAATGNEELILEQYQAFLVEEDVEIKPDDQINTEGQETRPTYGNDAIDPNEVVTDQDIYDTKVEWGQVDDKLETEWYEPVYEPDNLKEIAKYIHIERFPTVVYVSIATPLAILLILMIACGVTRHSSRYRRSVTVRSRPLSDSHKEGRVSVISICDSDVKKSYPPLSATLPSYLEVISEKVETVPKC